MMKYEFETLAGYEVSTKDYNEIIEPMYMATNLSKEEFVKTISKKRFALRSLKSIIKEMKTIAKEIENNCYIYYTKDLSEQLENLFNEYIGRKYEGMNVNYFISEGMKFSCFYPMQVEFYNKDYKTLETIDLLN